MQLKEKLNHPWLGGLAGGALLALGGVALMFLTFGRGLEDWSSDLSQIARAGRQVDNVVVVDLGRASYEQLGQSPESFDRALHAQLIQRLQAGGAKLIVFDIEFLRERPYPAGSDQKLAAAIRAAGNVVLGANLDAQSVVRIA